FWRLKAPLLRIVGKDLAAVGRAQSVPRVRVDCGRETSHTAVPHGGIHGCMGSGRQLPVALVVETSGSWTPRLSVERRGRSGIRVSYGLVVFLCGLVKLWQGRGFGEVIREFAKDQEIPRVRGVAGAPIVAFPLLVGPAYTIAESRITGAAIGRDKRTAKPRI